MHQYVAWADFPLVQEHVQPEVVEIGGERPHPVLIGTGVGDEDVSGLSHSVLRRGRQPCPRTLVMTPQRAHSAQVSIVYHIAVRHSVQLRLLWRSTLRYCRPVADSLHHILYAWDCALLLPCKTHAVSTCRAAHSTWVSSRRETHHCP